MLLRALPLLIAILPLAGATVSHWIAARYGLVPGCIPYLEGCTSISATGRYEPASFLFRAVFFPLAGVLIVFWPLTVVWLRSLGEKTRAKQRLIVVAGVFGGLSLIVYVTFLGTNQPFYEFMRRYGIYGYFLGTAVAQLSLALASRHLPGIRAIKGTGALLWLALLPFLLGILNLILKGILDDADRWENRIEWIAALSMQLYYVMVWWLWRATRFRIQGTTAQN